MTIWLLIQPKILRFLIIWVLFGHFHRYQLCPNHWCRYRLIRWFARHLFIRVTWLKTILKYISFFRSAIQKLVIMILSCFLKLLVHFNSGLVCSYFINWENSFEAPVYIPFFHVSQNIHIIPFIIFFGLWQFYIFPSHHPLLEIFSFLHDV